MGRIQQRQQRGRPIQEVANELRQMCIRLPELSATQMYYQLKAAMDMELHSMVTPHIYPQMEWQQMIDLIVRYDDSLSMKKNRQSNSYVSGAPDCLSLAYVS